MADSVKVTNQSEHVEQTVNSSVAAVHTGTNPQSGLSPVHIEPKNKAINSTPKKENTTLFVLILKSLS